MICIQNKNIYGFPIRENMCFGYQVSWMHNDDPSGHEIYNQALCEHHRPALVQDINDDFEVFVAKTREGIE